MTRRRSEVRSLVGALERTVKFDTLVKTWYDSNMPRSSFLQFKSEVKKLRLAGKTYTEINSFLGVIIPKSTLSLWFRNLKLSGELKTKLKIKQNSAVKLGSARAVEIRKEIREHYLENLFEKNKYLGKLLAEQDIAKLVLATLYLGEGSKNPKRGSVVFGNSDPRVIGLFLELFRRCYKLDETKFRCTVQCRADQDIPKLESFWHKVTQIPRNQFYGARIDQRTVGQKSMKPDYKGVCRIDYFSAEVLNDILKVIEVITGR